MSVRAELRTEEKRKRRRRLRLWGKRHGTYTGPQGYTSGTVRG